MKRKNFISLLGIGAGSVIISSCLGACGKSDSGSPAPGNPNPNPNNKLDFTLDVSNNAELNARGWTIQNGVIIARSGAAYIALSAACTHQQNPVTYSAATNTFPCSQQDPGHGSVFNASGVKISGPAIGNLTRYNTSLNGNILRVFES